MRVGKYPGTGFHSSFGMASGTQGFGSGLLAARMRLRSGVLLVGLLAAGWALPIWVAMAQPSPGTSFPVAPAGRREIRSGELLDLGRLLPKLRVRAIREGEMVMGSPPDEQGRGQDELEHEVRLDRLFFISETECTYLQWEYLMGGPDPAAGGDPRRDLDDVAVASVNWEDAMEFCHRLTERMQFIGVSPGPHLVWSLPTEAQWEYACRAGGTEAYSVTGDEKVIRGSTNAWGLRGLHGGVMEWCLDWYGPYGADPLVAPTGPETGTHRVVRGGSDAMSFLRCRAASRGFIDPEERHRQVGFRMVLTLETGIPRVRALERWGGGRELMDRRRKEQVRLGAEADEADWMKLGLKGVPVAGHSLTVGGTGDVGVLVRWIPSGTFRMGSPASDVDRGSDELQRAVTLSRGFWMAETECTRGLWKRVMGTIPSELESGSMRLPMDEVSWEDAVEFCRRLTARHREDRVLDDQHEWRLPSEAEWEYACRAGTAKAHHGVLRLVGWYADNAEGVLHEVGGKLPNAWGLHDMHGNVLEWCRDWYLPVEGEELDPTGPDRGMFRVIRGGSWATGSKACRAATRTAMQPGIHYRGCGLRLVMSRVRRP